MKSRGPSNIKPLVDLFNSGSLSELPARLAVFLKNNPDDIDALNLSGLLEKRKGNLDKARAILERAYANHPNAVGVLTNLGNIVRIQGNATLAVSKLTQALTLKPNNSQLEIIYQSLGLAQKTLGHKEEALRSFKKGLKVGGPLRDELRVEIAHHYRCEENYVKASEAFEGLEIRASKVHQLECIYRTKNLSLFREKAAALISEGIPNPLLGALISHANISLKTRFENPFCNQPMELILNGNIPNHKLPESLIGSLIDFSDCPTKDFNHQDLLINGHQSNGNLLKSGQDFVPDLEKILIACINHYRKKYQRSNAPFLKQWPKEFEIYAWLVNIRPTGHLQAHMHKEGWLSGSMYLDIPEGVQKSTAGAISFGLDGAALPRFDGAFPEIILPVRKRQVVMFPSSLFHRTLPFNGPGKRVSLAFDVIPTRL